MGITTSGWSTDSDKSPSQPGSETESGTGGGTMSVWEQDLYTKIDKLVGGAFTNESSFAVPTAVTNTGWGGDYSANSKHHGVAVTMTSLDSDAKPLPGEAKTLVGGTETSAETVQGTFRATGIPNLGVLYGQSVASDSFTFKFVPSAPGLSLTKTDIAGGLDIGVVKYGKVKGTITDYNGNPVQGVAVKGSGSSAVTGPSGKYELQGPGGNTVNLKSLYGSYTESSTLQSGKTNTIDFQFPRLQVTVFDAELEPIENAKVEINGRTYNTDPSGNVTIDDAKLQSYDIVVMGKYDNNGYDVTKQGQEYILSFKPGTSFGTYGVVSGAGVKVDVVDAENGEPVKDCEVVIDGQGVAGLTDSDGVVDLIGTSPGEDVDIIASPQGNRYSPTKRTVSIPNSGNANISIELERNRSSPTY